MRPPLAKISESTHMRKLLLAFGLIFALLVISQARADDDFKVTLIGT